MQETIPLDELVREYFTDVCIDKRLSRQVAGTDRAVPDFVSDWLVSRYTTDGLPDEAKINAFLARHLPERKQKNTLLNELRVGGSLKILDAYSVRVDLKKSRLVLEIPCLDIRDASVRDDIVDLNPLLLVGNVWGSGTIVQRPKDDKPEENEVCMVDFAPMQTSIVELDYYIEVRKQFTLDQWRELLVRSMGYNPDSYTLDEQSHLLTRLTPLVQPRVNLIELAPKGTGKSYVFSRLSRHAWLISGGVVTRAQMFYNMQSKTAGVITRYDAVVLDEVQTIRFAEEGELIGAFKGYLEQGEFRVMGYRGTADAGLVLLANIPITSAGRPRDSELFKTLPSWLQGISATVRIPPKANTLSAPSRTPVPLKPNTIGAKRRVCSCDAYVLFGFRSTRGRLTAFSCAMILLSDLSSLPCEGAGPAVRQRCSDRRPGGAIWRPAAGLRRSSSAAQRGRRRRP